jgi:hypothetical protein
MAVSHIHGTTMPQRVPESRRVRDSGLSKIAGITERHVADWIHAKPNA